MSRIGTCHSAQITATINVALISPSGSKRGRRHPRQPYSWPSVSGDQARHHKDGDWNGQFKRSRRRELTKTTHVIDTDDARHEERRRITKPQLIARRAPKV